MLGLISTIPAGGAGVGTVVGPASSTDNALARWDGTGGDTLQDSDAILDDSGNLNITGALLGQDVSSPGNALAEFGSGITYAQKAGVRIQIGTTAAVAAGSVLGVVGYSVARTSGDTASWGLRFGAGMNGINLAVARAIQTEGFVFGSGKTLTDFAGHYYNAITPLLATLTNVYGAYHAAQNAGTNRRHVYMEGIAGGTIARFLETAGAPDFMVKARGEWTPAANETPIWIGEGATPTSRQLKTKDGASIGGGDLVCVLV